MSGASSVEFEVVNSGAGQPEISFLMPIYQQASFIREAVMSVLAQRNARIEIILSDDASTDKTYEIARDTIDKYLKSTDTPHRIVARKGKSRLRRDHLPLLIDQSSCDLVCQAHGDDVQLPGRAEKQVEIFAANPRITLISVGSVLIDTTGAAERKPSPIPDAGPYPAKPYTYEQIVRQPPNLVGFCQAWRKSAVASFDRLDSSIAAVSHDRILPFRAVLAGEVWHIAMDLVLRRNHEMAWNRMMFGEPAGERMSFGWNLCRVSALSNMLKDARKGVEAGMISEGRYSVLFRLIEEDRLTLLEHTLSAFRSLTAMGRQIALVDDETLLALRKAGKFS